MDKFVVVTVADEEFTGHKMSVVFLEALRSIGRLVGWEKVAHHSGGRVVKDRPEHVPDYKTKYVVIDGWWVRKHGSTDALAGTLARLEGALGRQIKVEILPAAAALLR